MLTFLCNTSDIYHPLQYPAEQFFHTDYRPLLRDRTHNVIDEQVRVCIVCGCYMCLAVTVCALYTAWVTRQTLSGRFSCIRTYIKSLSHPCAQGLLYISGVQYICCLSMCTFKY